MNDYIFEQILYKNASKLYMNRNPAILI